MQKTYSDDNWILIPASGNLAIYRYPTATIPPCARIASAAKLLVEINSISPGATK